MKTFDEVLLGSRIREVRKSRGYTSEQAAKKLNISKDYYRQIECGKCGKTNKTPSMALFVAICNLYHISPDYLLQDQLEQNEVSEIKELEDLWAHVPLSAQRLTNALIKTILEYSEDVPQHQKDV